MANLTDILAGLKQERDRIDAAIEALMALNGEAKAPAPVPSKTVSSQPKQPRAPKKRVVSKEARARMAAAQKARRERERKALA
jgi:hypothetical protein